MGMTIDEAIKALKWFMEYNEEDYYVGDRFQDEYGDWFYKVSERDFKAFRQAIETMHKYQKIEQILKSLDDGEISYPQMTYYLRKVLEDENIMD